MAADGWERRIRPYLREVSRLSFENVQWNRDSIREMRDFLSPWHHNIRLPHGIFTAYCADAYPAHTEIMQNISHQLGGHFKGKRVIDVGCLEGYFSAECALQGATVLGIDGKTINVKKCQFIKSVLNAHTLSFVKDDAMNITERRYGAFDVVLALGLLYHLDNPFKFLANLSECCDGFALIDTHIALTHPPEALEGGWKPHLSSLKEFTFRSNTYVGRRYREFGPGTSQISKDLSCTASLKNDYSVWLTEESLVRLLRDVGFEQVSKILFPRDDNAWWSDERSDARVLLLAVKKRNVFKSKIAPARALSSTAPET